MKNYAIILASGKGSRYGDEIPKQFVKIAGKTILEHSIEAFENFKEIDEIILVITPEYRNLAQNILDKNNYKKLKKLLNGGEIRKESCYIGVSSIEDKEANVLIHDCARTLVTPDIIKQCIDALEKYDAVNVAIPSTDTIVKVKNNLISEITNRNELYCSQTPQCFKLSLIKKAHELSKNDNNFTDDCALVVKYNLAPVYIVKGSSENIKITYKQDTFFAQKIFESRDGKNSN